MENVWKSDTYEIYFLPSGICNTNLDFLWLYNYYIQGVSSLRSLPPLGGIVQNIRAIIYNDCAHVRTRMRIFILVLKPHPQSLLRGVVCETKVAASLVPRPSFWWVWREGEGGSGHETRLLQRASCFVQSAQMWTDLVRSLKTVLLRCVSPSHGLTVTACHTRLAIYRDRHAGKGSHNTHKASCNILA